MSSQLIQLRRGNRNSIPAMSNQGEPLLALDTGELFYGGVDGSIKPLRIQASNIINSGSVRLALLDQFGKLDPATLPSTDSIVEGTNRLYFTEARVRNAIVVNAPLNFTKSSGVISIPQADATTSGYISVADWNRFNAKADAITPGTANDYRRGDNTWQVLNTAVIPEVGDHLYFSDARACSALLTNFTTGANASIQTTDTILSALGKIQGQINALDSSKQSNLGYTPLNADGGSITSLNVTGGDQCLVLSAGAKDYTYVGFYARTANPSTRSAWFGFGGKTTTTFEFYNEINGGDIHFKTTGSGKVRVNGAEVATLAHLDFSPYVTKNDPSFTGTATFLNGFSSNGNIWSKGASAHVGVRDTGDTYGFIGLNRAMGCILMGDGSTPEDTRIKRTGPGEITINDKRVWHAGNLAPNGWMSIYGSSFEGPLRGTISSATTDGLSLKQTGDTQWRFSVLGNGTCCFGDGSNAVDTYLTRTATDTLTINGKKIWHEGNLDFTNNVNGLIGAQKNVAGGIAGLDANGKILTAQLPPIAINDTFVVASETEMLALTAQRGDVAIRTDQSKTYILASDTPGTLGSWQEVKTPSGGGGSPVTSVNGQAGTVVLNADNISETGSRVWFTRQRVLETPLTGFTIPGSGSAVDASDSILSAFGKLQKAVGSAASSSSLANYAPLTGATFTGRLYATMFTVTAATDGPAFTSNLSGDGWSRLHLSTTGKISLGTGSETPDTTISRYASGEIQINTNKVWHAGNFDPATKQAALGFVPINKAGDIVDGKLVLRSGIQITTQADATTWMPAYAGLFQGWSTGRTVLGNNVYVEPTDRVSGQVRYAATTAASGHTSIEMGSGQIIFNGGTEASTAGSVVPVRKLASLTEEGNFTLHVGKFAGNGNGLTNIPWTALPFTPLAATAQALGIAYEGSYDNATLGTTRGPAGLRLRAPSGTGFPTTTGNLIHCNGGGASELLLGWSTTDGATADNYVRSKRDNDTGAWSAWSKLLTDTNFVAGTHYLAPNGSGAALTGLKQKDALRYFYEAAITAQVEMPAYRMDNPGKILGVRCYRNVATNEGATTISIRKNGTEIYSVVAGTGDAKVWKTISTTQTSFVAGDTITAVVVTAGGSSKLTIQIETELVIS